MLTLENFREQMEWLKERKQREDKVDKVIDPLNIDFPVNFSGLFSEWESRFVKILKLAMNDTEEWISYWIYDCEFGTDSKADSVRDKDNKHIPLRTIEDLYNLVTNKTTY